MILMHVHLKQLYVYEELSERLLDFSFFPSNVTLMLFALCGLDTV